MKYFKWVGLATVFFLMGCANQGGSNSTWVYPPLAIPLQPSIQQELQIARLNQLLQRKEVAQNVRAQMFAERGRYLDSVGLADLARLDYERSLKLNPAQSEVFNVLGVYFTQMSDYDSAFDAFDSSLELDPDNDYAQRNRAIALYYAERYGLALQDMTKNYDQDPSDPYRALWLYYIQREQSGVEQAKLDLEQRYQGRDDQWGWLLVGVTLDKMNENEALQSVAANTKSNVELAQKLTELYFYLAKKYQYEGQYSNAIALYKLSISLNVYEFSEHRYAFLELGRIFKAIQTEREKEAVQNQADSPVTKGQEPNNPPEVKARPTPSYQVPTLSS
ncbi:MULTISPECIES: lipoprotein NlpI [Vibrio]|uniref:Lipoprotein NlpI n=1 Tax=Vibrio casei TaxID=673372 RepID=A0A368LLP9_9VIBR|nr:MULTISPECIES: lipoprotein NlpI [Vibrio]RCS72741.1 lipoprotein NlpI [Vibrio casei]SJN39477.1 Lipoprotein nlpI precursor [Vibrio casei]HBV74963.1 lipoprotein NlpI [Vibrio sp.]